MDQAKETVELLNQAAKTRHVPSYNLALAYAALGDNEAAINWLRQAANQDDVRMRFVPVDPPWDELNRDERVRKPWPSSQQFLQRSEYPR